MTSMKKIGNIGAAFISSLAMAILIRTKIISEGSNFFQYINGIVQNASLADAYIFFSLLYFYIKSEICYKPLIIGTGGCFSVFVILGKSYWELGSWDFLFGNKYQLVIAVICFIGLWCFFVFLLSYGKRCLDKTHSLMFSDKKKWRFLETHFEIKCFFFLLLCWLPYILINMPGSLPYDGYRQLNMALGIQEMTNHHPYLVSIFLGKIYMLGQRIDDNFGILLIVFLNALFSAGVYTYIVKRIKLWGFKKQIYLGTLLFYAILPMWGSFVQAVIKDTIYFPLFCLYFVAYIDLFGKIKDRQGLKLSMLVRYMIISVLLMCARNNGFYIVFPATVMFLLISGKKYIFSLIVMLLALFSFNWGYYNVLLPINDVQPGGIQEMLSVPFQQTARFVKYYGDELSEEDKEAINHILDYNQLAEKYNPDKSDPVKDTIRKEITKTEWKAYINVYLKMLKKHPGVCIQATLNNVYGYFYPSYKCRVLLSYNYYIEKKPQVATGDLNIHYYNSHSVWREWLIAYSDFWQLAPGFAMLQSPGFYTWLLIISIVILLASHQFKELIVMSVPSLHLAICLVSPVNGLLRYAMPLMAIMPLVLSWTLKMFDKEKQNVKAE